VAERLRGGVDPGDAAELHRERVSCLVHVEAACDTGAKEAGVLGLAVPPALNGLRARAVLREAA